MNVEIVVFDGVDELDAVGLFEVFRAAAEAGADLHVRLVSADGARELVAAHGLRFHAEGAPSTAPYPDVLLVPGGGWVARAAVGVRAEAARGAVPALAADAHRNGAVVAAVCTGAMLLAVAGMLDGRPATTHHAALDDLQAAGARVVDARIVDDGDIVTAGGVTSGIDLALWLVERFLGRGTADAVARGLEHERRGRVWRRKRPQARRQDG